MTTRIDSRFFGGSHESRRPALGIKEPHQVVLPLPHLQFSALPSPLLELSTHIPLLYLPWTKFSAGPLLTLVPPSSSAPLAMFSSASRPYVPLLHFYNHLPYDSMKDNDPVNATTTTTLWRVNRPTREDRLARFEWALNGSLGRATLGRVCI